MTRKRRADGERNRRHIVETARAAFAADGLDLPVREVARRAGLGIATVYRHFPARPELVSAVLDEQVRVCGAGMTAALADPDAGRALRGMLKRFAESQLTDRGLNEVLFGDTALYPEQRRAHERGLTSLVERARRAGAIREDVTVEDIRVGLLAIASFRTLPARQARPALRRLVNLLLAAITEGPGPGARSPARAPVRESATGRAAG